MPDIRLIIALVLVVFLGVSGWYVKSLNDQVVKCKANTKIQQARYDRELKSYEKAIEDITIFYDGKIDDIDNFEGETDETDCEASKRFLDRFSY